MITALDFINPCKGTSLHKVPKSRLHDAGYYWSVKHDGQYVQIHKKGNAIMCFTSSGKMYRIPHMCDSLNETPLDDFIIEGEYTAHTAGVMGDRGKAARSSTYRADYRKGTESVRNEIDGKVVLDHVWIFDVMMAGGVDVRGEPFSSRDAIMTGMFRSIVGRVPGLHKIEQHVDFSLTIEDLTALAKRKANQGSEGIYLKRYDQTYMAGKRVNDAIKIKFPHQKYLLCVGTHAGEGKYVGMIGSLKLMDADGNKVKVSGGMSDADRSMPPSFYINRTVGIVYESFNKTYIQPQIDDIGKKADGVDL